MNENPNKRIISGIGKDLAILKRNAVLCPDTNNAYHRIMTALAKLEGT